MRQERRRYFRIETQSIVTCKAIDLNEKKTGIDKLHRGEVHHPDKQRLFSALDVEIQEALSRLNSKNPDIATILELFNRKINLLNHQKPQPVSETTLDQSPQKISLSACGLAFTAPQMYNTDQDVQWELVLLPDKIYILGYGRVASCDVQGKEFLVRVDFEALREEDLERLLHYIMRKEAEWIKTKRPIGQSKES